jgi:tetratricopeptide (TPR) repeat protein
MAAASAAILSGRLGLFHENSLLAIDLARKHNLQLLELGFRMTRFQNLLRRDRTGQILDELRKEVDYSLGLTGDLILNLTDYCEDALSKFRNLLECLAEAARDFSSARIEDAIRKAVVQAESLALSSVAGQFEDCLTRLGAGNLLEDLAIQLRAVTENAKEETEKVWLSLKIDLLLLAAEFKLRLQDADTAGEIYEEAEKISETVPAKNSRVHMDRSDFHASRKELDEAISHAEKAVESARRCHFYALEEQAAAKLNELLQFRQHQPVQSLDQSAPVSVTQIMSQLNIAHQALQERRFDDALTILDNAMPTASAPYLRRMLIRERAIVLYDLGRFSQAEADIDESISLLDTDAAPETASSPGAPEGGPEEKENLHVLKAMLRAGAGKYTEAWNQAEKGRSVRLKAELASKAPAREVFEETTFDSLWSPSLPHPGALWRCRRDRKIPNREP